MQLILVFLAVSLVSGCLTTTERMNVADLQYYRTDCGQKASQIAFLESQMSTSDERAIAYFNTATLFGSLREMFAGTYDQKRSLMTREYDAIARTLIWELRTQCS